MVSFSHSILLKQTCKVTGSDSVALSHFGGVLELSKQRLLQRLVTKGTLLERLRGLRLSSLYTASISLSLIDEVCTLLEKILSDETRLLFIGALFARDDVEDRSRILTPVAFLKFCCTGQTQIHD